MKYQNIVVLPTSEQPTMSSLEMVDYINAERKAKAEAEGLKFPCKKYRRLQHNNFMAKTPKVLGENQSAKFLADYTDEKGRTYPCYRFFKREACLMAMSLSYSYELQAQVFDHMTALEGDKDINLLHFSGLAEMAISEMQNCAAAAERLSFKEHGQAGSALFTLRKKEKKAIKKAEQLVKQGYEQSVALKGADRAVDHYRRSVSASARGKMFDDCLHIAKV